MLPRRRQSAFVRTAWAYVSDDDQWIVSCCGARGPYATRELSAALVSEEERLGEAVLRALSEFRAGLGDHEGPGCWPAFEVSPERSKRKFEQRWRRLTIYGANAANITWVVEGPEVGEFGLRLKALVAPARDGDRLESALRLILDKSRAIAKP